MQNVGDLFGKKIALFTWVGASAPTGDDQAYTIYSPDKIAIKTVEEIIANCRD